MNARILIVEDDGANRELLSSLLAAHGYAVLTAVDGATALETAQRHGPNLIMCAVPLSGRDAYEVARRLKAEADLGAVPLLAVFAPGLAGDQDTALAAGFNGFLCRPIDPAVLASMVAHFLTHPLSVGVESLSNPSTALLRPPVGGARILVADNEPLQLSLLTSLLEPVGYHVLTARSPWEALALALRQTPDLVICDVQLGSESGLDLLTAVQAESTLRRVPFVIFTATPLNSHLCHECLALGVARYLLRPMAPASLLAEIEACLAERRDG